MRFFQKQVQIVNSSQILHDAHASNPSSKFVALKILSRMRGMVRHKIDIKKVFFTAFQRVLSNANVIKQFARHEHIL